MWWYLSEEIHPWRLPKGQEWHSSIQLSLLDLPTMNEEFHESMTEEPVTFPHNELCVSYNAHCVQHGSCSCLWKKTVCCEHLFIASTRSPLNRRTLSPCSFPPGACQGPGKAQEIINSNPVHDAISSTGQGGVVRRTSTGFLLFLQTSSRLLALINRKRHHQCDLMRAEEALWNNWVMTGCVCVMVLWNALMWSSRTVTYCNLLSSVNHHT